MGRHDRTRATEECPHCGERFRKGRLACPACGSDAATGWQDAEEIDYRSVEIPDTWEELVGAAPKRRRIARKTLLIVLALLLAGAVPVVLGLAALL